MRVAFLATLIAVASLLPEAVAKRQRILVYSKCTEYCHKSIPTAHRVLKQLGKESHPPFDVVTTVPTGKNKGFEDRDWLFQFDALAFVSANKDILSDAGIKNMKEYIEAGGGFLGVHGSSDALTSVPWYGRLLGAYFWYHPTITHAKIKVHAKHPSVDALKGDSWEVFDEIYNFKSDPRETGHTVVLTVDEQSYSDPNVPLAERQKKQGKPHPIAWYKEGNLMVSSSHGSKGGDGRSFYTALGHTDVMWTKSKKYQGHILAALNWVLDSPALKSPKAPGQRQANQ